MPQPHQGPGSKQQARHLTANLFAIPFGLAGLAQAWAPALALAHGPDWPSNALWILAAAVWLITSAAYLANVAAQRRWKTELSDPTFGPFTALIVIVLMQLGVPLAEQARGAGEAVFLCGVILTLLVGAWITAGWITLPGDIRHWHPGYFLPTAAGGLLAGGGSAALGFTTLAYVIVGALTAGFALLAARTVIGLINGTFLPQAPAASSNQARQR